MSVTAARLLQHIGIASRVQTTELTNRDLDELLKLAYKSKRPDEQTALVIAVLGFLAAVSLTGKTREEREKDQIAAATLAAAARIAAMKAEEILPISRKTEEAVDVVAEEGSAEDQRMEAIFNNPIALCVFLRLTNIEDRLLLLLAIVAELEGMRGRRPGRVLDGTVHLPSSLKVAAKSSPLMIFPDVFGITLGAGLFVDSFTNSMKLLQISRSSIELRSSEYR